MYLRLQARLDVCNLPAAAESRRYIGGPSPFSVCSDQRELLRHSLDTRRMGKRDQSLDVRDGNIRVIFMNFFNRRAEFRVFDKRPGEDPRASQNRPPGNFAGYSFHEIAIGPVYVAF